MKWELPDGWRWVKSSEVIDVRDGTHDTPQPKLKGIPLITSKNLSSSGIDFNNVSYISIQDHQQIKKRSGVEIGDVLYSMIGTIGNPVVVEDDREFSIKNVALFKMGGSVVLPEFLKYLLLSNIVEHQLNRLTRGGNQKFVSLKILRSLKIPLPPLPVQKKIADILDRAAQLREWRREADKLTDEYLKSVFLDMFGDPVRNPKKFKVENLEVVMQETPQNGLYKPASEYVTNKNIGTPILRIDAFYDGKINDISKLKRLNCSKKEVILYGLEENDIVVNRVNSLEYLGKCALIVGLREETVFESNMMRFKVKQDIINPVFLVKLLCTKYIYGQILNRAKKAVNQASINQKDVRSFNIIIPPIDLQNKFASIVEKVEKMKSTQLKSKTQIDDLFNSLMQRAFRG